MSALISLLTSAFGGSLIGGIAAAFQKWQDNKTTVEMKRMELDHDKDMASEERAMMELQLTSKRAVAEIDANTKIAIADYSALEKSIDSDKATYATVDTTKSNKWLIFVDVIRGTMRPVLTGGLCTYCVFVTAYNLITYGESFPASELTEMTFVLVDSMATFTGVAVSWWFGSRDHSAHRAKVD